MSTKTKSNGLENGELKPARRHSADTFDPDEIRRLVRVGKERGLIRGGAVGAVPIDKNGMAAADLGNVRSQWMEVSPAMALRWLGNNFRNRPMREDTVKAYARDMVNRKWVPTHQGIAFNDKDELIDGQHRLRAIVVSGLTVKMMVTFGLPSKVDGMEMTTMDAVDRGATRSVGDQLTIQHGIGNGSMTAAICAALASLCYGERTRRLSVGQTLDVFREFEPAVVYVIGNRSRGVGLRATGVLAGFAFALMPECAKGPERQKGVEPAQTRFWETGTAKMFHRVMTGEGLEGFPVSKLLREFLTSDEAKLFTRSLDRGLAELVLQAIYLDQEKTAVAKLEMDLAGANHFRGLQRERVEKVAAMFRLPKIKE